MLIIAGGRNLQMIDNIDLGKTHEYFKWVGHEYAGEGRVKGRPRFVMYGFSDLLEGNSRLMVHLFIGKQTTM